MSSRFTSFIFLLAFVLASFGTAQASTWTEGGKNVLVLDCYYSDTSPSSLTTQQVNDLFKLGQSGGLDEMLRRDSFERAWYATVTHTKVQLPGPKASYAGNGSKAYLDGLTAAGYSASQFDRIMTVASGIVTTATAQAFVGARGSFYNGLPSKNIAHHELGHNMGLHHAERWETYPVPRAVDGNSVEYGDGDDIMGGGASYMNAYYKRRLDYLKEANGEVVEAANGQTYRIFDHSNGSLAAAGTELRAVRVPIEGSTFESHRQLWLSHTHALGDTEQRNGIQIHTSRQDRNTRSHRIDMSPGNHLSSDGTAALADIRSSELAVGQTYTDLPIADDSAHPGVISITPIAKGSTSGVNWIDVVVHSESAGANSAPTAAAISGASSASTGQSIALTASATDANGDTLAYFWDFGDGITSSNSAAVQNKSWPAAGYYLVNVTISDRRGGVATAQHWVNVGGQTPRTPENDPTIGDLAFTYYEGIFTVLPNFDQLLPDATGTIATVGIPGIARNDDFALEITGYLEVPATDIYQFVLNSEDGSRLFVGNTLVIENAGERNSPAAKSGNIALDAGKHAITVQLQHRSGPETLELSWATLGQTPVAIGPASFAGRDWQSNVVPSVTITNPADGGSVAFGSTPGFTANASDADGIAKVQFYLNGSFLGEDVTAPYTLPWSASYAGSFTLTALVYDNTGRTAQAQSTFSVSTPDRNQVAVNFVGSQAYNLNTTWALSAGQAAGAIYQNDRWNNFTASTALTNVSLTDQDGTASAIRVSQWSGYNATGGPQYPAPSFQSQANASTPNGKMLKGLNWRRYDQDVGTAPYLTFDRIPYQEYEVYVYFDYDETGTVTGRPADTTVQQFVLTSLDANMPSPAAIFGKSSLTLNDGFGDWPNYDTWTNFKEATATSAGASSAELLGNYVVFRNLTASSFKLLVDGTGDRYVNGLQIVELPSTIPRLHIVGGVSAIAIAEGGAPTSYEAVLTVAPTSPVAVTIGSPDDVDLDKHLLYFTPQNWNIPQTVNVYPLDNSMFDGDRTVHIVHTLSGSGNYSAAPATLVPLAITDNEVFTVSVSTTATAAEAGLIAGKFRVLRSGAATGFDAPLVINFTLAGTAANNGGDYAVSGSGVTYNTGSGIGTVTIPANSADAFITVTPVNDTAQEGTETVLLTLTSASGHPIASPGTATLTITDNDVVDYFTQLFTGAFDLNGKTLTLTPNASPGYYGTSITTATALPESTTGHTNLASITASAGNSNAGWWTRTEPVKFFGTTYNTIYVATEGRVLFGTASNAYAPTLTPQLSTNFHFYLRHLSLGWMDLAPGVGGNVYIHRASSPNRTIVTYANVEKSGDATKKLNAQVVFFDTGVITMTWINTTLDTPLVGISNLQQGTLPPGFIQSDLSSYTAGVTPVNSAPTFASSPSTSATTGVGYSASIVTTDVDGDGLTLTAPTKPAWLTFTPGANGAGTLSGTPGTPGSYPVVLQVADGVNPPVQQSFSIVVRDPLPTNAPSIIESPTSVSATFNGSTSFRTVATGTPMLSFQWFFGGLALTDNGHYTGSQAATLVINGLTADDAGSYYCVVTNTYGEATSSTATLEVGEPIAPAFTTQPEDQTVAPGAAAVFSVAVTGTTPMSYRWQKGGSDLTDGGGYSGVTTANLTISNAQLANEGVYRVLVSNPAATDVVSDTATLEVNNAPQLAVDSPVGAAANLANVTDRLVLETTVSDDGKPSTPVAVAIAWSQISGPGTASFEDPSAADTTVTFDQAGSYVLRITADDGLATTTRDVTVAVGVAPAAERRYLINFSEPASASGGYASDGTRTWQTFDLNTGTGSGTGSETNPKAVNAESIVDESGSSSQGLTFSASGGSNGTVAWHRNATAAQLSGDPFDWFNGGVQAQRDCFAVQNGSAPWTFTINGLNSSDEMKIEFVFARFNTGDRAMTVTYQTTGDVLNDAQVDEDGGPQYPVLGGVTPLTGASSYAFTLVPSGTAWGCLPNAIALTVSADASLAPVVDAGPDANVEVDVAASLAGSATDDGLPNPPAVLSYQWSQLSGPGTAVFGNATSPTSTVTFPVAGTYTLRLTASDGAVQTSDIVTYTVSGGSLTPAETWRQLYFSGQTSNTGNAADGFDYDNDGMVNLLERALGTDPTDNGSVAKPTASMVSDGGFEYPAITYQRVAGGTGTTGVDYSVDGMTYTVVYDDDLAGVWSSGAVTVVSTQTDTPSPGIDTVTVRLNTPINGMTKQFIRIKVVTSP